MAGYDENVIREGLRQRGLLPTSQLGATRLRHVQDDDNDPSNDRFAAYVIDARTGQGREADLSREEANYLQANQPDAEVLKPTDVLVGPEQEDYLRNAGRRGGPSAREVALARLAAGESGPMTFDVPGEKVGAADAEAYVTAQRAAGDRIVADLDRGRRPFQGASPAMLADAESQVRSFQQGLNARGQPARQGRAAPPLSRAGATPSAPAFTPLARGAPQSVESSEGIASRSIANNPPSAPPASGKDEEYARALAQARDRRMTALLGEAAHTASSRILGLTPDNEFFQELAKESDSPVRELLAQRDADRKKRLNDPMSPESKRLQAAVGKALPGVYTPEELAGITAADEEAIFRTGEMRSRLDERRAAAELAARTRQEDITIADRRAKEARDFEREQGRTSRGFQAAQANALFERQKELARINNAADLEQAQARAQGTDTRGTVVPGLETAPGAAPTAEDAKKVKASMVASEKMRGYVSELRALHKKYGTEYGGAAGTRMEQLGKAIQLEAKTIAELGALSGPDQALMESIAGGDPSSLSANLKAMVGVDNTETALKGLEDWVGTQVDATQRTYGYQPRGGQRTAAPSSAARRVTMPDGTKWVEGSDGQMRRANDADL